MDYKRLKSSLFALLLLLAVALPAPAAEKSFHILMINDPHSYILPYYEAAEAGLPAGAVKAEAVGGLSRALRLVADEKAALKETSQSPIFLFEGGDIMLGKKGSLQNGHAEYGSLAVLGFDAGVLGNHDFDGGVRTLAKLGPELKFPVLASNIIFSEPEIDSYYPKLMVIKKGDVSVGVFGLVTQTSRRSSPTPAASILRKIFSKKRRSVYGNSAHRESTRWWR